MKIEFIKLVEYNVAPFQAYLGCVKTNKCVIDDDGVILTEKAKNAGALIIGAFSPIHRRILEQKLF